MQDRIDLTALTARAAAILHSEARVTSQQVAKVRLSGGAVRLGLHLEIDHSPIVVHLAISAQDAVANPAIFELEVTRVARLLLATD